jgi:signal transduction histidine kinase
LNDFVFTVSHDLKAPLRAIQGYADALLEDQAQKLDPDGRANIERIAIASQRLDEMIQDLLAYSRISSEQITMEPVDLKTLVKEVIDRLPPEAVAKNAAFSVDPRLPAVTAHRPLMEQILDNLVLNAVTYVKPGIRPEIKIWAEDQRGWTYLFVKDNGIGIAAEDQERIFKVFERLHGVESYPGTGVGLAIVKKGVERMNGKLGVISKPGEGSTIWIALPREIVAG